MTDSAASNLPEIPWWGTKVAFALFGGTSGLAAGIWAFELAKQSIKTTSGLVEAYPFLAAFVVITVSFDRIVRGLSDEGAQKQAYEHLRSCVPISATGFSGAFGVVAIYDAAEGLAWLAALFIVVPLLIIALAVWRLAVRFRTDPRP